MRRHNILREPTPPPIDCDEEDGATRMLKNGAALASWHSHQIPPLLNVQDTDDKGDFIRSLGLLPSSQTAIDSNIPDQLAFHQMDNLTYLIIFADIENSWNAVAADRLRRHYGQKMLRKRSWNATFPLTVTQNGSTVDPESPQSKKCQRLPRIDDKKSSSPVALKPLSQLKNGLLHPPVRPSSSSAMFNVANLAQLELAVKSQDWCNEASKLTSEVAFWLRHLTIPMARTLTSSNEVVQKNDELSNGTGISNSSSSPSNNSTSTNNNSTSTSNSNGTSTSNSTDPLLYKSDTNSTGDEGSSDVSDNESLVRWPGIDSVMVLYMAHQQGIHICILYFGF